MVPTNRTRASKTAMILPDTIRAPHHQGSTASFFVSLVVDLSTAVVAVLLGAAVLNCFSWLASADNSIGRSVLTSVANSANFFSGSLPSLDDIAFRAFQTSTAPFFVSTLQLPHRC